MYLPWLGWSVCVRTCVCAFVHVFVSFKKCMSVHYFAASQHTAGKCVCSMSVQCDIVHTHIFSTYAFISPGLIHDSFI